MYYKREGIAVNKLLIMGMNIILVPAVLMGKEKVIDPFAVNNGLIPSASEYNGTLYTLHFWTQYS